MDINKLTIFEIKALLQFLKDYLTRENLSIYEKREVFHLFLAFVKLQNSVDHWEEAMRGMD